MIEEREQTIKTNHATMVRDLSKPGKDIQATLGDNDCHMVHMLLGVSGEVGELVDALKKRIIYGKPLDITNIIEELGDIEFYLEGIRQGLGISRIETLIANLEKLGKRYPEGSYADHFAQARLDKAEEK